MSQYLDPVSLARLKNLELRARSVVEGALSGLHRSPHHGSSVEFAEHKEYSPGDEIRHIDWKAYGKFDRYYVKRYEEETELTAYLLLDRSGSMAYRSANGAREASRAPPGRQSRPGPPAGRQSQPGPPAAPAVAAATSVSKLEYGAYLAAALA